MKSEPIIKSIDVKYGAIILESECDEECIAKFWEQEMKELIEVYTKNKADLKRIDYIHL